jgi:dephospho-CoA kinase
LKLIGLTGGAGSGKSTAAEMFRELGAAVVDADEASHAAYAPGSSGFDAVVQEFGRDFVRNGQIDRARLGELVFHDEDARARLNGIVHPLVRRWMAERTVEAQDKGAEVIVHDVPLLFESGLERLYSDVVLVHVPEKLQLRRLVDGRGVSEDRARAMIAAQMPIDEKRGRAQHVIDNSGTRDATRAQVEKVWAEIAAAR